MKAQKNTQSTTQVSSAKTFILTVLSMLISTSAMAASSGRKVVDPKSIKYGNIAGELTIPGKPHIWANAYFVGSDGCQILTNYHAVFADSMDPTTKKVKLVKPRAPGYEVNVAFDLDGKTGKFRRRVKAVAMELANYDQTTTEGMTQDMALLRVTPCAGSEFAGPELDRPEYGKFVPTGELTTISTRRKDDGTNELLVETGCVSAKSTSVAGLFYSNCHIEAGMSGSMIVESGADGKSRLVGMSTSEKKFDDGFLMSIAVHSSSITPFVESVLGEQQPLAIAPLAEQRAPQSTEKTALVKTKPSTVVR